MTSPGWRTEPGTGEGLLSFGEMLLLAGAEGSGEEETTCYNGGKVSLSGGCWFLVGCRLFVGFWLLLILDWFMVGCLLPS